MRSAATFVLVTAACVGLPPSPPQHDDGTATDPGSSTIALDSGVGPTSMGPTGDDAGSTEAGSTDTGGPEPACGDAVVEPPEECDLGGLNGSGMYCTSTCTSNICGDGYVGPGESCDDANDSNDDACTTLCGPSTCGDGTVQAPEACDDGGGNAETGACLPSCVAAACGDLFVYAGVEICDGTNIGADSCATQGFERGVLLCTADCTTFDTSNCQLCGNGVIEPGETCDTDDFAGLGCPDYALRGTTWSGGALVCADACATVDPAACTFCGDAVLGVGEPCEGQELGDATCTSVLGDGFRGMLACTTDCAFDTSACCAGEGSPCGQSSECCSSSCNGGTLVCDP